VIRKKELNTENKYNTQLKLYDRQVLLPEGL